MNTYRRPIRFYATEFATPLEELLSEPDESEQLSQALDLLRRIADMPALLDSQFDGLKSEIRDLLAQN